MICVWEQADGPCMFLLTLVQILGQIKDATWLQKNRVRRFSLFCFYKSYPVLSPLFASFPQIPPFLLSPISPFSSCPTSIFLSHQNISIAVTFSQCFSYPDHSFTTCQGRLGLVWFLPYTLGAVQLGLHWAGRRVGLRSGPGPTVRK